MTLPGRQYLDRGREMRVLADSHRAYPDVREPVGV